MTKNDLAWEKIFANNHILDAVAQDGSFEIASSEINKYRESRLMTKIDHKANLPSVFKNNGLSILPITRGSYTISDYEAYATQVFDDSIESESFEYPSFIESLTPQNIYSESAAINCAYLSGMLNALVGEDVRHTISGKMGTSKFAFNINRIKSGSVHRISVDNCQCEIDGGFESDSSLVIIEAKNAITEDFIIRQLFYPYRLWSSKVSKKVVPIFLCYSNDVFHFFEYAFSEEENYNSIRLVKQRNFVIAPERIELDDIAYLLRDVKIVEEPNDPFPQADKFERVVDLVGLIAGGTCDAESITLNYDFDPRQTGYYTSGAKYLGLIKGNADSYSLTKSGVLTLRKSYRQKYLDFAKRILEHKPFNLVCHRYLESGKRPTYEEIVDIMKSCSLTRVNSESTYQRRARTVISWVDWILRLPSAIK